MQKTCESCGSTFETEFSSHRFCKNCFYKNKPKTARKPQRHRNWKPDSKTDFTFENPKYGYLKNGYFKDSAKTSLFPQVVDQWAEETAKFLGNQRLPGGKRMSNRQVRMFFQKAKAVSDRLKGGTEFSSIQSDIVILKADASRGVSRGVVPDEFRKFIEINVGWATGSEKEFQNGFIKHFQCMLSFFAYYFRD